MAGKMWVVWGHSPCSPGANRMKSAHEIKQEKNRITGIENVDKRFEGLAQGELVFWYHRNAKAS